MSLHFTAIDPAITWTTVFVVLLNVLVGGVFVAIIRTRPALKKIAADREANLLSERAGEMAEMRERIEKLEASLEAKDRQHADELAAERRLHEAQKAADRHRMNNLNMAFQSLLMLLKQGVPVEQAVNEVEAMRSKQLEREAAEATAIRAAAIRNGLEPPE
jgi:hypothetical protein